MIPTATKPCLRINGLHIEGLRSLRKVSWPEDGLGWNGRVPDLVMVGGVNGSGKTTLLELIANVPKVLDGRGVFEWNNLPAGNAWIDLGLSSRSVKQAAYRIILGDPQFVHTHIVPGSFQITRSSPDWSVGAGGESFAQLNDPQLFNDSDLPRIVYLPSDRRFEVPHESFKKAGAFEETAGFSYRFRAAEEWKSSLEALLYGARWADLNAKEEGHPERATHFEAYDRAFQAFFGGAKKLFWSEGRLFVKIADTGALHPLMELSSGEKQALLLAAELYRLWRPGSLILIDEPELHFHTSWQTTLWTMLEQWQKERGGQVIVATQSAHLFRIAAPETTVLLGGPLA